MAQRTTIYCNDETESRLKAMLSLAISTPAIWSQQIGKAAPTNLNQLVKALVDLGYETLIQKQNEETERRLPSLREFRAAHSFPGQPMSEVIRAAREEECDPRVAPFEDHG